jgi:hypothetical protein
VVAAFWVSFASSWSAARPANDPFDGASASGSLAWSTVCQYKKAAHYSAEYKPGYQAGARASAPSRAGARDENSHLGFLAENARFCVPRACANHETASGSEAAAGKIASGRIVHNYFVGTSGVLVHNAQDCELAVIRSSNGTEGRAVHGRSQRAVSHDAGVQLGREFLGSRYGLTDAGFVNPFEFHGSYGQGFDDVLMDANGNLWIAEYKGGSARLNGNQMQADWVQKNIERLKKDKSPWGKKLEDAHDQGKLFGIAVSSPDIGANATTLVIEQWAY